MAVGDGQSRDEKKTQNKAWKNDEHRFHLLHIFPRNNPACTHLWCRFFLVTTHVCFFFILFVVLLGILNAFQLINSVQIPWHIFSKEFYDPRNYCLIRQPDVGFIFVLLKTFPCAVTQRCYLKFFKIKQESEKRKLNFFK